MLAPLLDSLTERQRIAITRPSASAMDSLRDEFKQTLEVRGRSFSTIVTVNK
jgi:hypothetical protein